jgi:hypothetical protein
MVDLMVVVVVNFLVEVVIGVNGVKSSRGGRRGKLDRKVI